MAKAHAIEHNNSFAGLLLVRRGIAAIFREIIQQIAAHSLRDCTLLSSCIHNVLIVGSIQQSNIFRIGIVIDLSIQSELINITLSAARTCGGLVLNRGI